MSQITVISPVKVSQSVAWEFWTPSEHLLFWHIPSEEWRTIHGGNDLRAGGKFNFHMEPADGNGGFDFLTRWCPQ